jgi:hypothetical protein
MDVLDFAKIQNRTRQLVGLDQGDYHSEIQKRAEETRSSHESEAQAYTRILLTPEGKELYKAYRNAPVAANPKPAVQDLKRIQAGEATRDLEALAQEMADRMKVSREKAYTSFWTDPRRAELVAAVKQEERELAEWIKTQREPTQAAYDQYRRDWRLGRSKGSARK